MTRDEAINNGMECGCRKCGKPLGIAVPAYGRLPLCSACSAKHRKANRTAFEQDKARMARKDCRTAAERIAYLLLANERPSASLEQQNRDQCGDYANDAILSAIDRIRLQEDEAKVSIAVGEVYANARAVAVNRVLAGFDGGDGIG